MELLILSINNWKKLKLFTLWNLKQRIQLSVRWCQHKERNMQDKQLINEWPGCEYKSGTISIIICKYNKEMKRKGRGEKVQEMDCDNHCNTSLTDLRCLLRQRLTCSRLKILVLSKWWRLISRIFSPLLHQLTGAEKESNLGKSQYTLLIKLVLQS